MDVINVSNARTELFNLIKEVNSSHKPIQIVNKSGNAAVLLSLADWSAIEETLYLNSVPGLAESIIEASNAPDSEFVDEKDVEW